MAHTIQIATKDGPQSIEVYRRIGPFAVHYTVEAMQRFAKYGKRRDLAEWSLTHVPSGKSVLRAYSSPPLLRALAMLQESSGPDGVDWATDLSKRPSAARERAGRAVNLLRAANMDVF